MARKDRHSVLVAGAGPAGLAAALFLRQRGVDVEVVDERPGDPEQAENPAGADDLVEALAPHLPGPAVVGQLTESAEPVTARIRPFEAHLQPAACAGAAS